MIVFPNCKINLGLHITGKREDGYHNLETIFYPVPVTDVLEILPAREFSFTQTGLTVAGDTDSNLCVKAWRMIRQQFPAIGEVSMHLHKCIPMGAGLGGGSSDGAHTLLLANQLFGLGLSTTQLIDMALELGSDCPFFILNQPCLATGRGEIMEPLPISLKGYQLVLLNTGIHINTGWAFRQIEPNDRRPGFENIPDTPISQWQELLGNDFEPPVFREHTVLQNLKDHLLQQGAIMAAMTGSGSTLFGIFPADNPLPSFEQWPGIWVKKVMLEA